MGRTQRVPSRLVGKSGIFDHQWSARGQAARIYKTEVVREPDRLTRTGEPYCWLKGYAYMVRTEGNRDLIREIEGGIKREVSVGCAGRALPIRSGTVESAAGILKISVAPALGLGMYFSPPRLFFNNSALYLHATQSISIRAPSGSSLTPTTARAGAGVVKRRAYTSFMAAMSFRLER